MSDGKIFSLPARGVEMRQADCFAALPALPANSVDCVLTDPPYFLDGFDSDWDAGKLAKRMEHNGAIRSMPAGMKFCPRQGADFQRFFGKFSREIVRVLKPGGFFVSFSQGRLYHRMAVAAEEAGFEIRDMLAWKREGQPKAFTQSHFVRKMKIPETRKEEILRSLRGRKTPQLRPQMEPMMLAQKPREGTFIANWLKWETGLIDTRHGLNGGFPGTVLECPKPKNGRKNGHLTVKPTALIAALIRVLTVENQLILDPFFGSGTTAEAAMQINRRFLGFEKQPRYFAAAVERVRAGAGADLHFGARQTDD